MSISLIYREFRQKADVIAQKCEFFREKIDFTEEVFFQVSQNPVRERKVYKTKVMKENSAIKYYREFHVRSDKGSGMLILGTSFLLLTKVIL